MQLKDYRALVTGGGSGIGRASVLAFAREGAASVTITGRREHMLQETAELVQRNHPKTTVHVVSGDISDASFRTVLKEHLLEFGSLDVLVNNAGVYHTDTFSEVSDMRFRELMSVNLDSVFALCRDLFPLLVKSDNPAIVNVGSTLGIRPIPQGIAYNVAKAAVDHLTRSLAGEMGPSGVRVNCVSPGVTETDMYRGRFPSEEAYQIAVSKLAQSHPLRRIGKPEDIAEAVVFLAGPAATWITGVVLPVDGGLLNG